MLLNELIDHVSLPKYSCVIVDEAHERSIDSDLLLGLMKQCLKSRPDFKLVVSSATLDEGVFSTYFNNCPTLEVPGKVYPVDIKYENEKEDYVQAAVDKTLWIVEKRKEGDILVFLTGQDEIEQAYRKLKAISNRCVILMCHGKLPPEEQCKVFEPAPSNKRKIVLATNCAETSVTIDGIKFVVDTGKVKEMVFDEKSRMNVLKINFISQSSAEQRKGRAGRTASGTCFRLYSKKTFKSMEKFTRPEILRTDLDYAVLKLKFIGIENVGTF
ncbi:hypothetical protein AKO1_010436, partial [Acrasis kona]